MKYAQVSTAELTKQKKGYQRSKINSMKSNEKARLEKKGKKESTKSPRNVGLCEET